jgi:hypothetical protein
MLIVRAIALSLALLVSLGVIIPMATNYSEAGPRHHKKKKKKLKKYSKAWWKWYRAKKRKQNAIAARKRALRLRQRQLAKMRTASSGEKTEMAKSVKSPKTAQPKPQEDSAPALLPSGDVAPKGWKKNQATPGELQFRVDDDSGKTVGTASLGVVGPAVGADTGGSRGKTVGGVQTSALRRTVIDRMMKEQGWVVNDFQKEVGGKRVYVVVAQSPGANGRVQARHFYFTEVEGRIYSLATNASDDDSVNIRIAEESEKVINSLQRANGNRPVQQAGLR